MSPDPKVVDLKDISEIAKDYKLLQARNSKGFIQLMVDVCASLNACPMGKLKNLDVEELKNQTGFLLYYEIKGLDDPIPCDIDFVPQLYSHFRKPTILVMRRIQKHLNAAHRRILGRLEREQALERVVNMGEFDVSAKIRNALNEMNRYQSMATMVRGGGRKLDILTQALHVPTRARFELITIDRILRDNHHIRHDEAMEWLDKSKFKGNPQAVHGLIKNGFQMLDNATNKVLDLMEELAGVQFPRDSSNIDLHRNWYSLGNALPRGEDFVKTFTAEEKVEHKIKRLTYPMIRVAWDADRLRNQRDRILVDLNVVKIQAAQLANLIFDLEKKITSSTKPDGEVMSTIESDFNLSMLSIRERDEAEDWAKENKIKLQDLMMETYENLKELKGQNPNLALPEELEATIARIRTGLDSDRQSYQDSVETSLSKLSIDDLVALTRRLERDLDHPSPKLLEDLVDAHRQIIKRIDTISIKNIDFHKRVRDGYKNFQEYENRVLELYKMEEQLESLRMECENWLVGVYRETDYEGISEKTLGRCMEIVIEQMLLSVKQLSYGPITAADFETRMETALAKQNPERMLHLDQLLQEIQSVPRADQLLNALKDWEKDLSKDEFNAKEAFVLENNESLQTIVDRIGSELRELLNSGIKGLPRRLRFEIFGLADCYSESLRNLLNSLMTSAQRLSTEAEGEQLVKALQSLESQVLEAQKNTRANGDAYKRLTQMLEKESVSKELVREMERDLGHNFTELDTLLEEVNLAMKRIKASQNRFGAQKDTDYLDVTININDIEKLRGTYDFIDGITMEDTKRFCVAYNLKSALINNVYERASRKDPTLPKEVMQHINPKNYKLFVEKRFMPMPLRTAIMTSMQEIFESEVQLLCHTLNLVKAMEIRKKASYQGMVALLSQAKGGDHVIVKSMGLLWGRIQTRMFAFKPVNHVKNYEGNRQAMMTDIKETLGEFLKR